VSGKYSGPVTVRVPATSANLGPGFDSFGLALSLHDIVTAEVRPAGLTIEVTGSGAAAAGAGEQHLVVQAMRTAFALVGGQPPGLALSCQNAIPQGFGLGSSAGAIVAGLLAARALAGPAGQAALPDEAVFRLASRLEGHPDNVAACLAGGLTIAWADDDGAPGGGAGGGSGGGAGGGSGGGAGGGSGGNTVPRFARLQPLPGIAPVLCVPDAPLATVTARQVLPAEVPHADAAANSARAALLVTALTSRPDLLMDATQDFLHQRYRAAAMPATAALIGQLRAAGIPAVVSGAGPSVLAFTTGAVAGGAAAGDGAAGDGAAGDSAAVAGGDAAGVGDAAARSGSAWRVLPLPVQTAGAVVQDR
jgi:homoserine kinase